MAESYNITAVLNAKIDGLVNGFKQATSTVDGFVKRNEKTFDSFKQVGKVATGAGLTIAAGLGYAVNKAADFEGAMSSVAAISGATGKDLDDLTQTARDWGASTSFSATEAAEGLEYMALAGWNTQQMMGGIGPVLHLAEAGALDLGRASDLVTDSMAGLGLQVDDLDGYLDKVAKTASSSNTDIDTLMEAMVVAGGTFERLNVPLEESNAFLGVLANRGFKGSEAGTALNAIMSRLGQSTGPAADALKEMGVSAYDSQGNFRGMETVMMDVEKKMSKMTDAEKAHYQTQLAGVNHGKTFNAMLSGLGDEYSDLKNDIEGSDGALIEMRNTMKDNLQGALENLSSAFEEIAISIGTALLPLVKTMAEFVQSLADRFNNLDDKTKTLIAIISALAAGFLLIVGPILLLIGFIPSIIAGLTALGTVFTVLTGPIGLTVAAIAAIVAGLILAYNKIEWFRDAVNAVWEFIKFSIQFHIDLIMQIIDILLDWVMEIWEEHGEEFISAVMAIWDTIVEAIQTAIEFVQEIIEMITDYINEIWEEHGEFIMAVIDKVWTTIKDLIKLHLDLIWNNIKTVMNIIKGVFEVVWPIISNIIKVAWNLIKTIVKTAIDLVAGIIKTVMSLIRGDWSGAWNSIKDTVTKIWDNIIGFFKSVDLVQIGKDIIQGLIKGISSMVGAVSDAVKNVTSKITGTVKKILGIKSPSRVFMGFGDNISEGLANGIDNAARLAEKASEKLGIGVEGAFNPQLAVDGVDIADQVNDVNRQTKRQFSNHMTSKVDIGRQAIEINIYDNKEGVRAYVNENNAIDSTIRRFDD